MSADPLQGACIDRVVERFSSGGDHEQIHRIWDTRGRSVRDFPVSITPPQGWSKVSGSLDTHKA